MFFYMYQAYSIFSKNAHFANVQTYVLLGLKVVQYFHKAEEAQNLLKGIITISN